MPYALIIQALMGMAADAKAGKIDAEKLALLKKQLSDVAGIPLPELEKIAATQLPASHVAALQTDTGLRSKQMESLAALQDIIDNGGMSLEDRVAQEAALSRSAGAARRGRAGIAADLASRGQLNSGAALQMGMAAEQQNANSARQSGMEAAANAQRRKMEALRELGGQAGSLRGQDRSEASEAARAADERNRWNASAQEKAQYYNAGLPQQQFGNQMAKATGQAGAVNNLAGAYGQEAQGIRDQGAKNSAAVGQAVNYGVNSLQQRMADEPSRSTYSWNGHTDDDDEDYFHEVDRED